MVALDAFGRSVRRGMAALAIVAGTAMLGVAPAEAKYFVDYEVTLPDYAVDTIVTMRRGADWGSTSWASQAGVGTTLISDVFGQDSLTLENALFGLARDLPGDGSGDGVHLVLFTSVDWAQSAQGLAFGTLFPSTLEADIISAMLNGFADNSNPSDEMLDASLDTLGAFYDGAASSPNGAFQWAPGDNFSVIAFSTGQIIGSGTSSQRFEPDDVPAVPEPASWAMLIVGFGLVGSAARRRTRLAAA